MSWARLALPADVAWENCGLDYPVEGTYGALSFFRSSRSSSVVWASPREPTWFTLFPTRARLASRRSRTSKRKRHLCFGCRSAFIDLIRTGEETHPAPVCAAAVDVVVNRECVQQPHDGGAFGVRESGVSCAGGAIGVVRRSWGILASGTKKMRTMVLARTQSLSPSIRYYQPRYAISRSFSCRC